MSAKFLHRADAPFDAGVWEKIDGIVVAAAKKQLSARRVIDVAGPFGIGVRAIPGPERKVQSDVDQVSMTAGTVIPLMRIQSTFSLSTAQIAAFERDGFPFDAGEISRAASACAKQEEKLLYYGSAALNTPGILTAGGVQSYQLREWSQVGTMIEDIIQAATVLDNAGFHGPYALVLAPGLYNLLYRRYPNGGMTELDHVQQVAEEGVFKSSAIDHGGVLLASGKEYASIVVGQDLMTGFIGPCEDGYDFLISETIALLLKQPGAFCVLKG